MEHDPSSAPLLQYAKPPRWHRRRRYRRLALLVLLVGAAVSLWHWREPIRFRWQVLYWQHRCLTYTAPADQMVGLADSSDAAVAFAKADPAFTSEVTFDEGFARRTCPTWDAYRLLIDGPLTPGGGVWVPIGITPTVPYVPRPLPGPTIAFMHERTSAAGKELVVVFLSEEQSKITSWELNAYVYRRSIFPEQVKKKPAGGISIDGGYLPHPNDSNWVRVQTAKFFAGQVDANDASRFSLRYELDGAGGNIDGQLLPDDTVNLLVRDGPASPPGRWRKVDPEIIGPFLIRD